MAVEKQIKAAKKKVGAVKESAKEKITGSSLPKKVKTVLEKPQAAAAKLKKEVSPSSKTRKELYEEAKKRDIPGRSKMSKEQLARALRKK